MIEIVGFDKKRRLEIDENIINTAIETFGTTEQILVACEEMGELIQVISKLNRTSLPSPSYTRVEVLPYQLKTELADVFIALAELIQIYDIDVSELDYEISYKLARLKMYTDNAKRKANDGK